MEQEIDEYIEYIGRNRGKSDNTIASYKSDLYKLMNYLKAEIKLEEWAQVTETDINSYILYLQSQGCEIGRASCRERV